MATNHEAGSSNLSECKNQPRGLPFRRLGPPWAWDTAVVGLALLDGLWAAQALAQRPGTDASVVTMASLAVWLFLHLPAAAAGGLILHWCGEGLSGGVQGLSLVARWTLGALGSLQTLALGLWLARRLRR
jgi:hypothetical protein